MENMHRGSIYIYIYIYGKYALPIIMINTLDYTRRIPYLNSRVLPLLYRGLIFCIHHIYWWSNQPTTLQLEKLSKNLNYNLQNHRKKIQKLNQE